jgi:RNA polymerase sigma-70 factor (ECF subfamily)
MSLEWPWQRYRALLCVYARQLRLDPRLRARISVSDVVQNTVARALERGDQCHADNEAGRLAWLRAILRNEAIAEIRKNHADKCDVDLERSINDSLDRSSARLDRFLADRGPRPDEVAARKEQFLRLADALEELPEDQREAFIQHHLLDMSLKETAREMGRPEQEKAVSDLIYRAKRRLGKLLEGPP